MSRRTLATAPLVLLLLCPILVWSCGTEDPLPTATCGDGEVSTTEACDDFNAVSGDGCSSLCEVESGFTCSALTVGFSVCTTSCGDSQVVGAEQCDDGNVESGDGCSSGCRLESAPTELCANGTDDDGDGLLDCVDPDCFEAEECETTSELNCEDEVDNDTDGRVDCADIDCMGKADCGPETTQALCSDSRDNDGDGQVDCADEECQLYCDPAAECGDGDIQQGEECDEGEVNSGQADALCRPNCELAGCGDGILDSDEVCDDGVFDGARCRPGCVGSPLLACPDVDPAVDLNSPESTRSGDRFSYSVSYPVTQRVDPFVPPQACGAEGQDIGVAFTAPAAGLWLFDTAFDGTSRLTTVTLVNDCNGDEIVACGSGRGSVIGGAATANLTAGQDIVLYLTNSSGNRGGTVSLVVRPIAGLLEEGDDCSSDPGASTVCDPADGLFCGTTSGTCEVIPLDERQLGESCDPAGVLDRCARALSCSADTGVCDVVVGSTCQVATPVDIALSGANLLTLRSELLRSAVSASCDLFDRGHIVELRTEEDGWVDLLVESDAGAEPSVLVVRPECGVPSSETSCNLSDEEGISAARVETTDRRASVLIGGDEELTVRTVFVPYPDEGEDCDPWGVVNRCPSETFCLNSGECAVPEGPTCDAPIDLLADGTGSLDRGLVVLLESGLTSSTQVATCGGEGVDIVGQVTMPQAGLLRVNYVTDDPELVYHVRSDCFDVETELLCVPPSESEELVSVPYQEILRAGETRYFLFDSNVAARGSVVLVISPRSLLGEACGEDRICFPGLQCEAGINTCQLPEVLVGEACEMGDRCEDGAYCSPESDQCILLHGDGQQCPSAVARSCAEPQVCLATADAPGALGLCSNVIAQVGERCALDLVTCDTGLGCYTVGPDVGAPGVCVEEPATAGSPCSVPGAVCASGLNCVTDPGLLSGSCQTGPANLGSACGPGVAVCNEAFLTCFRETDSAFGTCGVTNNIPDGAPCSDSDACESGLCSVAGGNVVGVCGSVGAGDGEACTNDSDCAFFLRCGLDGPVGTCYVPRFVDEACSEVATEQCLPEWFLCEEGQCVVPPETIAIGASCEDRAWCGESGICHPLDGKLSPQPGARCRTRLSVGQACNSNPEDGVCPLGTACNGEFCSED